MRHQLQGFIAPVLRSCANRSCPGPTNGTGFWCEPTGAKGLQATGLGVDAAASPEGDGSASRSEAGKLPDMDSVGGGIPPGPSTIGAPGKFCKSKAGLVRSQTHHAHPPPPKNRLIRI